MSSPCCETVLLNIMKHQNLSLKLHLPKRGREGWLFKLTQKKRVGWDAGCIRDKNSHGDVDHISYSQSEMSSKSPKYLGYLSAIWLRSLFPQHGDIVKTSTGHGDMKNLCCKVVCVWRADRAFPVFAFCPESWGLWDCPWKRSCGQVIWLAAVPYPPQRSPAISNASHC